MSMKLREMRTNALSNCLMHHGSSIGGFDAGLSGIHYQYLALLMVWFQTSPSLTGRITNKVGISVRVTISTKLDV